MVKNIIKLANMGYFGFLYCLLSAFLLLCHMLTRCVGVEPVMMSQF